LLVTVERYPDLKSNQNFLALKGTENRILIARRDYIDSVRAYNTELKTFPGAGGRTGRPALHYRAAPGAMSNQGETFTSRC